MTHKESWEEMKRWMHQGEQYLLGRLKDLDEITDEWADSEIQRIEGKLDGLRTCREYMEESERIYKLKEVKKND